MTSSVPLENQIHDAIADLEDVRVAYLFGSRAGGRPRDDSDLDIGVAYRREMTADEREQARREVIGRLTDALGALGERSDVVDLDRCLSAVAFRAIRDGKRVLARSESDRVRVESGVARRYDDDAPRRALFRRAAVRAARRMGGER